MRCDNKSSSSLKYRYHHYYTPPRAFECLDLLQIGTAKIKPGGVVASHKHLGIYELTVVESGRAFIYSNSELKEVKPGEVFLSLPYDTHCIEADAKDGLSYSFFAFYLKDRELVSEFERISLHHSSAEARTFATGEISSLILSAISEINSENMFYEKILDALFLEIIVKTQRALNNQSTSKHIPKRREEVCFQVMNYINSHIFDIKSLTEITEILNYDYTYISKVFSETMNESISDYYRKRRLDGARSLVLEKDRTFSEIAEKLGYSSIYSFSKAFKKQYGMSPRAYRNVYYVKQISEY